MSIRSEQSRYELDLLVIEAWQRGDPLDDIMFEVGARAMALGFELDEAERLVTQQYDLSCARQSTEEAITRLAALSGLRYERLRQSEAKRLGMRVRLLDAEVAKLRGSKSFGHSNKQAHSPTETETLQCSNEQLIERA